MNTIDELIATAVAKPTLRVDEAPRDGSVRTPLPRLALRIGFTGHRPDRLNAAARKLGMTPGEYQSNLAGRLAEVFADIESGIDAAHRETSIEVGVKRKPCFDQSARPLLRLVSGLALGADTVAMRVVDQRFRGMPREACDSITAVRRMRPDGANASEWQIDGILPCKLANFALDAMPDFLASHPDSSHAAVLDHWRAVSALPDTLTALPAQWRIGEAPARKRPDPDRNLVKALKGIAVGNIAGLETPPDVRLKAAEQLRLDYGPAAAFLLRQIDILVVVWDGEPARGPGGAPDIVAAAVDLGLPVIMVDADEPSKKAQLVTAVDREVDASVTGWHPRALTPRMDEQLEGRAAVAYATEKVLALPSATPATTHSHGDHRTERAKLADFLDEEWPTFSEAKTYRSFRDLVRRKSTSRWADIRNLIGSRRVAIPDDAPHRTDPEWRDFINDNPDEGLQAVRLKRTLHRRFVAADLLAVKYADLYRSAFIKAYLWAAVAVALAIMGFLLAGLPGDIWFKAALVLAELWVIYKIWRKVHDGERRHWHEKFVHYRALAESLRHLRFLATFAEYGEGGSLPGSREVWWGWYLRATTRELGLPSGQLDAAFQSSLLRDVAKYEVDEQISYHAITARLEMETDKAVHDIGHALFKLTGFVLGFALLGFLALVLLATAQAWPSFAGFDLSLKKHVPSWGKTAIEWGKPLVGSIASLAPTLGAALAGIRFTADFDGKAARSVEMGHSLNSLRNELEAAAITPEFSRSSALLRKAAEILAEDVGAFLAIFGRKPLTLPG